MPKRHKIALIDSSIDFVFAGHHPSQDHSLGLRGCWRRAASGENGVANGWAKPLRCDLVPQMCTD